MNQVSKISLISRSYTYSSIGVPITEEHKKDVFAFVFSVGRSEFFNAGQHGLKPAAVYAVRSTEYGGQSEIESDGERLSVYRTYARADGRTELYTSRRKGANDDIVGS